MTIGFGYMVADIDTAADTKYYGYLDGSGGWYIMREITSASTFRYARGGGHYATNWANRATLTYGYLSEVG